MTQQPFNLSAAERAVAAIKAELEKFRGAPIATELLTDGGWSYFAATLPAALQEIRRLLERERSLEADLQEAGGYKLAVKMKRRLDEANVEIRRLLGVVHEAHQYEPIQREADDIVGWCICPDCAAWRSSVEVQREQG